MNITLIAADRFVGYAMISGLCMADQLRKPEPPNFELAALIGLPVAGAIR
jgi:hypothetical protein